MDVWFWVSMGLIALILIGAGAWMALSRRRRRHLRDQFGPEYERTVTTADSRREAEKELTEREKRTEEYPLRPLSGEERARFADEVEVAQQRFVDDPRGATSSLERTIADVMRARGYPDGDAGRRADDLSVHHPDLAEDYRTASSVAEGRYGDATTEDHRQALIRLRRIAEAVMGDGQPAGPGHRTIVVDEPARTHGRR